MPRKKKRALPKSLFPMGGRKTRTEGRVILKKDMGKVGKAGNKRR